MSTYYDEEEFWQEEGYDEYYDGPIPYSEAWYEQKIYERAGMSKEYERNYWKQRCEEVKKEVREALRRASLNMFGNEELVKDFDAKTFNVNEFLKEVEEKEKITEEDIVNARIRFYDEYGEDWRKFWADWRKKYVDYEIEIEEGLTMDKLLNRLKENANQSVTKEDIDNFLKLLTLEFGGKKLTEISIHNQIFFKIRRDDNDFVFSYQPTTYKKDENGKIQIKIKHNKMYSKIIAGFKHFLLNFAKQDFSKDEGECKFFASHRFEKLIRKKGNERVPDSSYAVTKHFFFDYDFKGKTKGEFAEWIEKNVEIFREFFDNYPTSFAFQLSRSGLGFHIFFVVKEPEDTKREDLYKFYETCRKFAQVTDGDTTIFEPARICFPSPYDIYFVERPKTEDTYILHTPTYNEMVDYIENFIESKGLNTSLEVEKSKKREGKSKKKDKKESNNVVAEATISKKLKKSRLSRKYFKTVDELKRIVLKLFKEGKSTTELEKYWKLDKRTKQQLVELWRKRIARNTDNIPDLDELVDKFLSLEPAKARVKFGQYPILFFTDFIYALFAKIAEKEGKSINEYINYYDAETPYYVFRISPDEETPFDAYVYANTNIVTFQSAYSVKHLGLFGFWVQGVKPKVVEKDGKHMIDYEFVGRTSAGNYINKPILPEWELAELLIVIADNFGVEFPKAQEFIDHYYRVYGTRIGQLYISEIVFGIIRALLATQFMDNETYIKHIYKTRFGEDWDWKYREDKQKGKYRVKGIEKVFQGWRSIRDFIFLEIMDDHMLRRKMVSFVMRENKKHIEALMDTINRIVGEKVLEYDSSQYMWFWIRPKGSLKRDLAKIKDIYLTAKNGGGINPKRTLRRWRKQQKPFFKVLEILGATGLSRTLLDSFQERFVNLFFQTTEVLGSTIFEDIIEDAYGSLSAFIDIAYKHYYSEQSSAILRAKYNEEGKEDILWYKLWAGKIFYRMRRWINRRIANIIDEILTKTKGEFILVGKELVEA